MHVAFITPGFPKDEVDSITIPALQAFAHHLASAGVKVSVIALDYPEAQSHYSWRDISVHSCGGNNTGWPLKLFTLFRAASIFRKINSENPVSVLHSFWWQDTALLGNRLSKKYGIPHLTTLMGQDVLPTNRYSTWLSTHGKTMVTLSGFHEDAFKKTFGRASDQIIPWGIDKNDFASLTPVNRDIDILGVGWLNGVKNFSLFIDVVKEVSVHFPQLKCVITGDGEQRKVLEDKTAALQLQNQIWFTGLLPRSETLQLMARSKVLLHTSNFESFGYVFAEALNTGTVIVSHETGIANSSNALIGHSVTGLSENVRKVLSSGRDFNPMPVFPIEQTTAAYLRLYKDMLNRNK